MSNHRWRSSFAPFGSKTLTIGGNFRPVALGVHQWVLTSVFCFSFSPPYCRFLRLLTEELCCFSMKSRVIVPKGRQYRCSPALQAHSCSAYNTVQVTGIDLYPNAQQQLYPPHSWGTQLLSPSSALSLVLFCILNCPFCELFSVTQLAYGTCFLSKDVHKLFLMICPFSRGCQWG